MAKSKMYYDFYEHNDWEGEKWHFYIAVSGNEEAVSAFKADLKRWKDFALKEFNNGEDTYGFGEEISAKDIAVLAKHDECTYMSGHEILDGKLDFPRLAKKINEANYGQWGDPLYKGGIRKFMKVSSEKKKA